MAIETGRAVTRRDDSSMQGMLAALLCLGLAPTVLARAWGSLLEASPVSAGLADGVASAATLYAAISGGHAYVFWTLNGFLGRHFQYRGADRTILFAVAVLCVDVVADLYLALSGAKGFAVYPVPLGFFTLFVSYPQILCIALGIAQIAVGYSLLRCPTNPYGMLRPAALAAIATGAAAAGFTGLWPLPAAVMFGLLGLLFFRAVTQPSEP